MLDYFCISGIFKSINCILFYVEMINFFKD